MRRPPPAAAEPVGPVTFAEFAALTRAVVNLLRSLQCGGRMVVEVEQGPENAQPSVACELVDQTPVRVGGTDVIGEQPVEFA